MPEADNSLMFNRSALKGGTVGFTASDSLGEQASNSSAQDMTRISDADMHFSPAALPGVGPLVGLCTASVYMKLVPEAASISENIFLGECHKMKSRLRATKDYMANASGNSRGSLLVTPGHGSLAEIGMERIGECEEALEGAAGVSLTPPIADLINCSSNDSVGNKLPSYDFQNASNTRDSRKKRLPRQSRLTSMFGSGSDSIAPCCRVDESEKSSACAVEGATFCLGALNMAKHGAEFGGGPGIDRNSGESVQFCGVGAKYRLKKNSLPGKSRCPTSNPRPSLLFKDILHKVANMAAAADVIRNLLTQRKDLLEIAELLKGYDVFGNKVTKLIDFGAVILNGVVYPPYIAPVIMNFKMKEYLSCIPFSDEDVIHSLVQDVNDWVHDLDLIIVLVEIDLLRKSRFAGGKGC